MDCIELKSLLAYTRAELNNDAAAAIEAHLDGCRECAGLLASLKEVAPRLDEAPAGEPPDGFRHDVLDRLPSPASAGRSTRSWARRWASAAAAVVITLAVQAFVWNPLAGSNQVHTVFAFAGASQTDAILHLTAHPDGTYSGPAFTGRHTPEQIGRQLVERELRFSHVVVSAPGPETVDIDLTDLKPLTDALGISSLTLKGSVVGTMTDPAVTVRGSESAAGEKFRLHPILVSQRDLRLVCHGGGLFASDHFDGLRTVKEMLATAAVTDGGFDSITLAPPADANDTIMVDLNELQPLTERLNISSLTLEDGVQGLLRHDAVLTPAAPPPATRIFGWLRRTLRRLDRDGPEVRSIRLSDGFDGRVWIEPALVDVDQLGEIIARLREHSPDLGVTLVAPPEGRDGFRTRIRAALQEAGVGRIDFESPPGR